MAYGIEIRTASGTKVVLDPTFRPTNLITCKISGSEVGSVTLGSGTPTSASIACPGMTSTNTDKVWTFAWIPGLATPTGPQFNITRSTDSFTITYTGLAPSIVIYFIVGRNNL